MALLLSVFDAQVDNLLTGDTHLFSVLARYRMITAAVEQYSHDNPDTDTEDVTGDGGKYYVLTTILDNWTNGFSRVTAIDYPAATIASDEVPVYLDDEDWIDDRWAEVSGTATRHLYLPNHAPASTETMRITYTVPWLWVAAGTESATITQTTHGFTLNDYVYLDGSTYYAANDLRIATHQVTTRTDANDFKVKILGTTLPTEDFFAVCYLAAGIACQAMAAKFAQSKDSTIAVDSATHTSKSTDFASRAEEFFKLYRHHMGLDAEQVIKPSNTFVDFDTIPGWPSTRQFIFRNRAIR